MKFYKTAALALAVTAISFTSCREEEPKSETQQLIEDMKAEGAEVKEKVDGADRKVKIETADGEEIKIKTEDGETTIKTDD